MDLDSVVNVIIVDHIKIVAFKFINATTIWLIPFALKNCRLLYSVHFTLSCCDERTGFKQGSIQIF